MVTYREIFRFAWQFMRPQKWVFLFIFITAFSWSFDALLWPYILRLVIDVFTRYEGNRAEAWGALQGPIFGGLALVICIEGGFRTMGLLLAKAIPKLEADIRMRLFDHVQGHSPKYFNERFAGSLANQITDVTSQITLIIEKLLWPILPALGTSLLGAVFLWLVNPLFSVIMMAWVVFHVAVSLKFARSCDAYEHTRGESRTLLIGKIVDSLTNNFAVNLFYRFARERKYILSFQKEEEKNNSRAKLYVEKLRCYLSGLYFLLGIVGMNGVLLFLWVKGVVSTGQAVQVFNSSVNIVFILWGLSTILPALFQSFGTLKQGYLVMKDPQDVLDAPGAVPLSVSSGEIVFDDVHFRYGEKPLFQNKQVRIRGGEKVGLVGVTGAGKSTFINLILRFYPLEKGKILIDGRDISQVTLESLRGNISLIPQDPILFHRTLRENILYGKPDATEEEVITAAKRAHCDAFIRATTHGYDSTVGERGTKLSGGEKQRIAIARALLANTPILILDEATSSLDSMTERYIQDSLDLLMKNRTTLVIAHRLSTLSRMDRILVFDQGKIVEEGTHADLLEKGGLYCRMWNMQVGGFLPERLP